MNLLAGRLSLADFGGVSSAAGPAVTASFTLFVSGVTFAAVSGAGAGITHTVTASFAVLFWGLALFVDGIAPAAAAAANVHVLTVAGSTAAAAAAAAATDAFACTTPGLHDLAVAVSYVSLVVFAALSTLSTCAAAGQGVDAGIYILARLLLLLLARFRFGSCARARSSTNLQLSG
jgi:hypothetical protein